MLHLRNPQMLQMLEKSLRKHLPESLKVNMEHSRGKGTIKCLRKRWEREGTFTELCPGTGILFVA